MSKYNLIRNGFLTTLTTSGTGNIELNQDQLYSLMDNNLTSSGVSLITSDVLCLLVDLGQRIKIDGVRLYANDLSKSSNIKFYYKNEEGGVYNSLVTQSGIDYYFTTIPTPSAPRYIKTTVSGVAIELYEFQIFNDDYIVDFGINGDETSKSLNNTPIGEVGPVELVAIYNNGDGAMPANAYTCIDYTGLEADSYIEISSTEDGPFFNITDGVMLEDNALDSIYTWDAGSFNNTKVENNNVVLSNSNYSDANLLIDIPLIQNNQCFNTGSNTWDYDRINKKIYVIGRDNNILKLWNFDYGTNTWDYIGEVNPGGTIQSNMAVMAYCSISGSGRIYSLTSVNDNFGYYDLSGAQDNWTPCASPGWIASDTTNSRVSMCSDGNRYIYALLSEYGTDSNKSFKQFDTVSGTWSDLNNGYDVPYYSSGGSTGLTNTTCLTYDYDRSYIYLVEHAEELDGNMMIQRYMVDFDSWNTSYFNINDVYNISYAIHAISYFNDWLYVSCNPYFTSNYFFRYNVSTASIEKLYLGYKHRDPNKNDAGVNILAFNSSDGDVVLIGQLDGHSHQIAKYVVGHTDIIGTYTTPIFELENSNKASYFLNEEFTNTNTAITYDNSTNSTIRIKSSGDKPMTVNKVFWSRTGDEYVDVRDMYTGIINDNIIRVSSNYYYDIKNIAVNRHNGRIGVSVNYGSSTYTSYLYVYNYDYSYIDYIYNPSDKRYLFNIAMDFDNDNGVWGYGSYGSSAYTYYLIRVNENYDNTSCTIRTGSDFLYDFAVEWDGTGLWYTDKIDNLVKHISYKGDLITSILLNSPRGICATADNGCWVSDNNDAVIRRYSSGGTLLDTIEYSSLNISAISRMYKDFDNGFWFYNGAGVGHIDDNNQKDLFIEAVNLSRIRAGHRCCIVFSYTNDDVRFIDLDAGAVTNYWTTGSTNSQIPGLLSFSYDDYKNNHNPFNIIPIDYDPVWGSSGSLEWKEIPKNGYFLPKYKYHQLEYTLRSTILDDSPELRKVILAPAIETPDIQPKNYKNIYVRSNIPIGAAVDTYETRLKTWWGLK